MDHFLWWAAWLVWIGLLKFHNTTCDQFKSCTDLEFEGLKPTDKVIEIKGSSYINLTARLKWNSECDMNDKFKIQIKVSYREKGFTVDACKIILETDCADTDSSNITYTCRCLPKRSVQFFQKVSRSDSRVYTWTWRDVNNRGSEKTRDIFISVVHTDSHSDPSGATPAVAATCVLVSVIVAVTGVGVYWKRRMCEELHALVQRGQTTDVNNMPDDHFHEDHARQADDQIYDHLTRL